MEGCTEETLNRAVDVLTEADWIDTQYAREIILRLDNAGLFIRENIPDPEEEPRPEYGSLESIKLKLYELHDHHADGREKAQELFEEWRTALLHFQPVFTAIQLALEVQIADSTVGDLQPNG